MSQNTSVHARIEDSFSAFLDDELPGEQRAEFAGHLATCLQCQTHFESFQRAVGTLGRLKDRAPATFLPGIQQQIFRRSRGRFFNKRWLLFGRVPFEWLSMIMIIAMLVYYIFTLHAAPTGVAPAP